MNYIPLKEIVSSLQNISEPIIEAQSPKKIEVSKKTLVLISFGFLSLALSLGIALGVTIQNKNHELKSHENLANFIQTLPQVQFELLNSAILHNNSEILESLLKKQPKNETIAKDLVNQAFFLAVELDNTGMVQTLITSGANVSAKNELFESPIHLASSSKMIKLLTDHGSDPNDQNYKGDTALHKKILDVKTVTELISNEADVNRKSKNNVTALMLSALFGKPEVVKVLLQNGANINDLDYRSETPLHYASTGHSSEKDKAYVAQILLYAGAKVDAMDIKNETALHYSSKYGDLEVANVLTYFGADPNARNIELKTPLHLATTPEMATFLLQHGAKIDAKNNYNGTKLCDASWNGDLEMVKVLLQYEAAPNALCYQNETALELATNRYEKTNNTDLVELLLKHGANANVNNEQSMTPLHFASRDGNIGEVQVLIKYGANVNATDESLMTPLHMAALGHIEDGLANVTEILLKNGANIGAKDDNLRTPLHYAVANMHGLEVAKVLVQYGADLKAKSKDGKTPLEVAIEKKNEDVVDFLKNNQ